MSAVSPCAAFVAGVAKRLRQRMTKRCCSERCRAALYRAPPGNRNELWECLSISDELETWDSGRQEEKDRRQIETFRRIHQLYKRGFRPDWTITDVEDAWRHPGGHPDLTLYADGRLFEMEGSFSIQMRSAMRSAMESEYTTTAKPIVLRSINGLHQQSGPSGGKRARRRVSATSSRLLSWLPSWE